MHVRYTDDLPKETVHTEREDSSAKVNILLTPRDELSNTAQLKADPLAVGYLMVKKKKKNKSRHVLPAPERTASLRRETWFLGSSRKHRNISHKSGCRIPLAIGQFFDNETSSWHDRRFFCAMWRLHEVQGPRGHSLFVELPNSTIGPILSVCAFEFEKSIWI